MMEIRVDQLKTSRWPLVQRQCDCAVSLLGSSTVKDCVTVKDVFKQVVCTECCKLYCNSEDLRLDTCCTGISSRLQAAEEEFCSANGRGAGHTWRR